MLPPEQQRLEAIIAQYEEDWSPALFEDIDFWLNDHAVGLGPEFKRPLLEEIVKVDLELCWRQSVPAMLERYASHFPEFNRELLLEEYHVRQRWGDAPALDEYVRRFGELGRQLEAELSPTERVSVPIMAPHSSAPSQIGRYRIVRPIGHGSFGNVYLALDPLLHRYVAIKVSPDDSQGCGLVMDEAATSASIMHPALVSVFDVVSQEGAQCIVMEYVNGCTLSEWIHSPEFALDRGFEILAQVSDALSHAHDRGLVHCDIKPSNILIDEAGEPRITDFGLAVRKQFQRSADLSGICGTPAYMAPEQVRGEMKWIDGRADIWAIGVIAYEMVTGSRPFNGPTTDLLFDQILSAEPKRPSSLSSLSSRVGKEFDSICLRCLDKPVASRWPNGRELSIALRSLASKKSATPLCDSTTPAIDSDLPPQQHVIGRDAEMALCQKFLSDADTSLITLHGTGGIGKTTLAASCGRSCQLFDHVVFLDLTNVHDATSLVTVLASKLQLDDRDDRELAIATAMRARPRTLLILDNFEQLVPSGTAVLSKWLTAFPDCKFLVTSRVRLAIPQEQLISIGPLTTGSSDRELSTSCELFLSAARRLDPDFQLGEWVDVVEEICHGLDGIPLGIELAASRVSLLSPKQILDRIKDRRLIRSEPTSSHDKGTLGFAVHWSIEMLRPEDRSALQRLALLPGGAAVDFAEALIGDCVADALDCIQRLRDHSLIRLQETPSGKRIAIFQPIRDILAEGLTEDLGEDGLQEIWPRISKLLAKQYMELLEVNDGLEGSPSNELTYEKDNLRLMLDWTLNCQQWEEAGAALLCLSSLNRLQGQYRESKNMLDRFPIETMDDQLTPNMTICVRIAKARNELDLGSVETAQQLAREAIVLANTVQINRHIAAAEYLLCECYITVGKLRDAEPYIHHATSHQVLEPRLRFDFYLLAAQLRRRQGNFAGAKEHLNYASSLAESLHAEHLLAAIKLREANLALSESNYARAIELLKVSEDLSRRSSNARGQHLALTSRGIAHCEQGEYDRAIECFNTAQEIAAALGEARAVAVNEGNRGVALAEMGDWEGAARCYQNAERINEQLGRKTSVALNQANRAVVMAANDDLVRGIELCRSGLEVLTAHEDHLNAKIVQVELAIMLFRSGATDEAMENLAGAIDAESNSKLPDSTVIASKFTLAECHLELGNTERATEFLNEASRLLRDSKKVHHILLGGFDAKFMDLQEKLLSR